MTAHQQDPSPTPRGRHAPSGGGQSGAQQPARAAQPTPRPKRQSPPKGVGQPQGDSRKASSGSRSSHQAGSAVPVSRTSKHVPQQRSPHQGARPEAPLQQGYRPAQPGATRPVASHGSSSYRHNGHKSDKQKKGGPWKVIFWIALMILIVALVALGAIAFSYWQGQSRYDAVAQEVFSAPSDIENTELSQITIDWDKLKAINPDTVAWVYIPGTQVNYPIVHTTNDDKYLTYDFDGKQTWGATYGSVFLSAANSANMMDANNLVYGHNLNNGSMFASVAGLDNAEKFNASRSVYILTPAGNYKLKTFSLVHCSASDPLAQTVFSSEEELSGYVQDKIDRSVVQASDIPAAADISRMFAFATCDNLPSDGRYVLFASIVEDTVAAQSGVLDSDSAEVVGDASKEITA